MVATTTTPTDRALLLDDSFSAPQLLGPADGLHGLAKVGKVARRRNGFLHVEQAPLGLFLDAALSVGRQRCRLPLRFLHGLLVPDSGVPLLQFRLRCGLGWSRLGVKCASVRASVRPCVRACVRASVRTGRCARMMSVVPLLGFCDNND